MKIENIDFPKALLDALRDNKLVVFAGAGVSMGKPASLPNFESLTDMIAKGTGKSVCNGQQFDEFLGRLHDSEVDVHDRAKEALFQEGLKATKLHQNLLRLYPKAGPIRLVTTNFDLLFEQAAADIFDSPPEVFLAPALPLGREFNGVVHVHGSVHRPEEMVLTDKDFGRAYLTEGWAQHFLVELFSNFDILFVGYRHNDQVMKYLARALPVDAEKFRFALTGELDNDTDWRLLGIKSINYPQLRKNDHRELDKGIHGLAEFVQRRAVDWCRKITAVAENPPPPDGDKEKVDLIEYALGDETKTRFFTKAASDPEWIDWLDERGHLKALFGNGQLKDEDRILSWWLAEKFAQNCASKLFLLIDEHNMRLHPHFWHDLARQIRRDTETTRDYEVLSRWISLLVATAGGQGNTNNLVHEDSVNMLWWIAKYCIAHGILEGLLDIFDWMIGSCLQIKQGYSWSTSEENPEDLQVDAHLTLNIEHRKLNELWEKGLKPKLPQVADPLLDRIVMRIKKQYLTLRTWGTADRNSEPASNWRLAIEPHEQARYPQPTDVLIDAARDCLQWLASNQTETATLWCNHHVRSEVPLLRRLVVHGLSKREDLSADDKIEWLLRHVNLQDPPIHHEVFQAVKQAYSKASAESRETLIEAVRSHRLPTEIDSQSETDAAKQLFRWFYCLHISDSDCPLAREAFDTMLAEYPHFETRIQSDATQWEPSVTVTPQSPWSPEELLLRPAADWLGDMLSVQDTEPNSPNRRGLMESVAEVTRLNFDWSLDLANALAHNGLWTAYLWTPLIKSWSAMTLDENRHGQVFYWLAKTELYPKHNYEIADALYALVDDDGPSYAFNLLPQAKDIATALWWNLDRTDLIEESSDWLGTAFHHPAGRLAGFWVSGFALWREQQEPKPSVLKDEYRRALSDIVGDQSLPGRLGRMALTNHLSFLVVVDAAWTCENLIPLFDPRSDDFREVWDVLLKLPRLSPALAEVMGCPFLKSVEQIDGDLAKQRNRFIKFFTDMIAYFAEDPICKWIPRFFQYSSQETKDCFALEVYRRLENMAEPEQGIWWDRWLKSYWKNRVQGVPAAFESREVEHMLDWLPHLTAVFPEAVDIAVQIPPAPLQHSWVISELIAGNKKDIWEHHPEAVAKLLAYLWKCNLPRSHWASVSKLINNLLQSNISSCLKRELEEIEVQL